MSLSTDQVFPAESIHELDQAPLVMDFRGRILRQEWGGAIYEVRNHIEGWITVIRGSRTPDSGHPVLLRDGWSTPSRNSHATAAHHAPLQVAEIAFGRSLADDVAARACTKKQWDDHNRIAVAREPGGHRWATAWLHNGEPGFTEHSSWRDAHVEAAQQLEAMADSFIITGENWTADVASAHLRRCANQVRHTVLTVDLGDAIRAGKSDMQMERCVKKIANGIGKHRSFLYQVFKNRQWTI